MTQVSFKRKLTAILSADVESYRRLMGEYEAATVQTITVNRWESNINTGFPAIC